MSDYIYSITPYFSDGCRLRPEPDTGNTPLTPRLAYGKFAHGNRRVTIAEDKYEMINGVNTQVNKANDVWLEVLDVDGTVLPTPGHIAEIHLGQRYATIRQIGTIPTPGEDIVITQTFTPPPGYTVSSIVNGNTVVTVIKPQPGETSSSRPRRVDAYGTLDETASCIGLALTAKPTESTATLLTAIQNDLFVLGAELACVAGKEDKLGMPLIGAPDIQRLEAAIDTAEQGLALLKSFVLPGGTAGAAALHQARTACRRAERRLLTASRVTAVRRGRPRSSYSRSRI